MRSQNNKTDCGDKTCFMHAIYVANNIRIAIPTEHLAEGADLGMINLLICLHTSW